MPAFADRVSAAQARDLVAYIRALNPAKTKPAEFSPSDFESRFQQLQKQWDELQKQFREVSRPPRKP
jgi:hypothetical protein